MPYIDVNQKRLNYADSHPAGAPPGGLTCVFIHGLGSSQNYYFPILPHLTSTHRCITIDTYGCGRSRFTGLLQDIGSIADDVVKVMDGLKIQKAVIVGHSMGGTTALHLAAQYLERVVAVVAIGPVHPTPSTGQIFEKRIQVVLEDGMEPMANTIPEAATGSRSTPLQKAFIRELLLGQDPAGYISLCHVVSAATAPDYAAISLPVLVIAGDEDKSAPLDGCKHILAHVSSSTKTLEVLPGVGHWHCIEASDEVGKLVAGFAQAYRG
ncbi:putative alpha/beta hydrolase [Talaromyces proteolyticus]|uniref:Alpha/beta hydrolase n=1 Tax=Talaromyces proteolyticus TaxID=1131652 RepID=A0AAD4PWW8_9EURO|nr:putative alpha/beta hydrolase [Talaromyces proteolyticus]KAH8692882.1 putative alpha/beta hydrolase [Talaromyces proteolyticus]